MSEISRHAMTAATVANVIELCAEVMTRLGTSDISGTLGGVSITKSQIGAMVNSEIRTKFAAVVGAD